MTLSIRLEGFPHEVDRMIKMLESNPSLVQVSRISRGYANRDSTSIRRYVEIQLAADTELGITTMIPIHDIEEGEENDRAS